MTARADLFEPTADRVGLLRVVDDVESFERKRGDESEQWIHILPFGPVIVARDGRNFQISDLLRVAARTETPLLIDWEHGSEWGNTKAAGWIEQLEIENGDATFPRPGLWGRAVWTDQGKDDVAGRSYRFLSPTVLLDKETRDAVLILAVALTNRPALSMQGLDTYCERMSALAGQMQTQTGDHAMQPENKQALCSILSLAANAPDTSIVEAARTTNAAAARSAEMCTRLTADLAAANTARQAAEEQLATLTRQAFETEIDRVLGAAAKDGKLTPPQVASWHAFCAKGVENFELFSKTVLPTLPTIGDPAPASPHVDDPPPTNGVRSLFGYAPDKLVKAAKYIADRRAEAASEGDD